MDASKKTKRELVEQVQALRSHLEELERSKVKHKQMEEALKESEEHAKIFASYQHTISELCEFYVREANLEQMLQKTVDLIVKDFGYYMAWYGELKVDEKVIIPKVWAGKYEKYLDGLRLELDDSKDAKCAMSIAIVRGKPFGYADLEHDKDFEKWRPLALKYGYGSNQAVPFIMGGKSIGAFLIYSTRPRAFSENVIRYLTGITNELATIVENITKRKKMDEALQKRTEELTIINEMAIELAVASSTADIYKLICEKLKSITGAVLTGVTSYDSERQELKVEHISADSRFVIKASKILGQKVKELRVPLEPRHIEVMLSEKARRLEGLYELMFGAIPRAVANTLQKILKIGAVYGLTLHHGGKIIGTMPILMPQQKPLLSIEMLKAFANLVATSLQRKKAEEERVAAVQERAAVIDAMSDALIVLNLDGEIISSNPAYLQMFGLNSVNEVLGRHFSELREVFCDPEENIPRLLELFKGLIENGFCEPEEVRIRRADGKESTVSASGSLQRDAMGNPKNVVAILRDVTEHKRLEEMEKEAAVTRMAVEMIEGMLESVTIVNLDGTIRQVNSEFERSSGWKREEVVGKTAIELGVASKTEWQRIKKEIMPKLMNEGSVRNIEAVVIRRDGTKFPALMSWTLVKDAEGKPKGIITVARDITERKRVEERLIEYQEQLRSLASELSLTEERERRSIATELHDHIGQDLALSMLKLDSLRKSLSSDVLAAPLDEISNLLEKAIRDTRSLIFNLSSPILYKFGFERAIADWLMEQIQKRHGIRAEFEDDGRTKPLEEDICVLLFQATRELLINVVRHAQARSVKVSIRRKSREIETIVEDDGVGLDLSKIGTVALTSSRFGLFSIRERLNYLGGHLKIESKPGHGTRVTLMAPLKTKKETPRED